MYNELKQIKELVSMIVDDPRHINRKIKQRIVARCNRCLRLYLNPLPMDGGLTQIVPDAEDMLKAEEDSLPEAEEDSLFKTDSKDEDSLPKEEGGKDEDSLPKEEG